ncbi:MAG: OmpA family protein [Nitrospiraceae bacterium]|nr:OmpA family protein [Nitrospiraceae bacterium]
MKKIFLLLVVFSVFIVTGCVSTSEYKARVSDIDKLKKDNSMLEERLKSKEAELVKSKDESADFKKLLDAKKDELVKNVTQLKAEIAALKEEKEKTVSKMQGTYDSMIAELNEEIKKGEIAVTQLKDKLTLSMVDRILFDSGSEDVKGNGKKVLDRVAEILKTISDKQIMIEGHTDNVPIGSKIAKKFLTNWELSGARATNVVKYLQEKGVDPKLLHSSAYAEYKPIEPNDTEEGRAKNRRIEIVLIPLDIDKK